GNRYVVDRIVLGTPPTISQVAGVLDVSGSDDGSASTAHFLSPTGLVFPFSTDDIFYVSDNGFTVSGNTYSLIRRVSSTFDFVTTVAGDVEEAFATRDGQGANARFAQA